MTKVEKLIARIKARPPRASFADVETLLRTFGWQLAREKGSHVTFTKAGEFPIVVPKEGGRWVKREYLDDICGRLHLDE
ncbi:MAG: type II toxin-antitoxin system HicA family toxin [Chloroflexota bacterium]